MFNDCGSGMFMHATRRITAVPGGPHVLILTTFDDDEYVYGALRAGAGGFLLKDMALEDILDAVRVVASGDCAEPELKARTARIFAAGAIPRSR